MRIRTHRIKGLQWINLKYLGWEYITIPVFPILRNEDSYFKSGNQVVRFGGCVVWFFVPTNACLAVYNPHSFRHSHYSRKSRFPPCTDVSFLKFFQLTEEAACEIKIATVPAITIAWTDREIIECWKKTCVQLLKTETNIITVHAVTIIINAPKSEIARYFGKCLTYDNAFG